LTEEYRHVPVLLDDVVEHLDPKPGETVCDCTIGGAGHTVALAAKVAAAPVSPRQRAFTDTATAAEGRAGLQGTPVPGRKGNVPRMPDLGGWVSRQIRIARKRSHARSLR